MSYRDPPPVHPIVTVHGDVCAFDPLTGRQVWHHRPQAKLTRFALAHERVYVVDQFCLLTCIDALTGAVVGSVQVGPRESQPSAIIAGPELVYVLSSYALVAVDPHGHIAWQVELDGSRTWLGGLGLPGQVVQPDLTV